MTRQTWEEELDSHRIERILCLLEEQLGILRRAFPPPQYKPSIAIVVTPVSVSAASAPGPSAFSGASEQGQRLDLQPRHLPP